MHINDLDGRVLRFTGLIVMPVQGCKTITLSDDFLAIRLGASLGLSLPVSPPLGLGLGLSYRMLADILNFFSKLMIRSLLILWSN